MKNVLTHREPELRTRQRSSAQGGEKWALQLRSRPPRTAEPAGWTRYERFSIGLVFLLSSLTLIVTAGLHLYNFDLETRSSSTSGSHSDFYSGEPQKGE